MTISKPFFALFSVFFFSLVLSAQPAQHGDCASARTLCRKDALVFESVPGPGSNASEVGSTACSNAAFPETHSAWFRWSVAKSGLLQFTLTPLHDADDLDFVLYRVADLYQCAQREEVRCMLAGPVLGEDTPSDAPCLGATGLALGSLASGGAIGCPAGTGHFLAPVPVEAGESYLLFVHNFRSAGGFALQFSGDFEFAEIPGVCSATGVPSPGGPGPVLSVSGVVPNPATGAAQINLTAAEAMGGTLSVADAQGRARSARPIQVVPGENPLLLDVSLLEPGAYVATIYLGEWRHSVRFFKQ